jgi:hypothetical protein
MAAKKGPPAGPAGHSRACLPPTMPKPLIECLGTIRREKFGYFLHSGLATFREPYQAEFKFTNRVFGRAVPGYLLIWCYMEIPLFSVGGDEMQSRAHARICLDCYFLTLVFVMIQEF